MNCNPQNILIGRRRASHFCQFTVCVCLCLLGCVVEVVSPGEQVSASIGVGSDSMDGKRLDARTSDVHLDGQVDSGEVRDVSDAVLTIAADAADVVVTMSADAMSARDSGAMDMEGSLDLGGPEDFDPRVWSHSFRIRVTPPEIESAVENVLVYLKIPVGDLALEHLLDRPRHEFRFVTTEGAQIPFDIVSCNPVRGDSELSVILRLPRVLTREEATGLLDGAQHLLMYAGNPSTDGTAESFWLPNDVTMLHACGTEPFVSTLDDVTGNAHHGLPVGGVSERDSPVYELENGQWGQVARFHSYSRSLQVPTLEVLGDETPFSLSFTLKSNGWLFLTPLFDGRPLGEEAFRVHARSIPDESCAGYISSSRVFFPQPTNFFSCSPDRNESYFTVSGSPSQGLSFVVDGTRVFENLPFELIRLGEMSFGFSEAALSLDEVYLGLYETSFDWAKVRHASMQGTLFTFMAMDGVD
ncbi:MAG: hypothetical protein ACPGQS_05785 [Bradymonadia bacterium]